MLSFILGAASVVASVTIGPLAVQFLTSTVIPIAVGVATKSKASAKVKQVINLVLNTATAVIIAGITETGAANITETAAVLAGMGLITSVAMYLGFYKPNDLNEKLMPTRGVGTPPPYLPPH